MSLNVISHKYHRKAPVADPRARMGSPVGPPVTVRPTPRTQATWSTPAPHAAFADPRSRGDAGGLSFLLFCVYTFVFIGRPQDYVPILASVRPAVLFTALTVVTTLLLRQPSESGVFRMSETRIYLWFYAAMVVGIPLGIYARRSFDFVVTAYVMNVIFFLLFVHHVNSVARFKRVVVTLAFAAVTFALLGLAYGDFFSGRYATVSTMFDPNDVCFVVISLLPFPVAVLLGPYSTITRLLALVGAGAGVLLALYTGSRGGLLGLTTFLLLFLVMRIPGVGKPRKIILIVALVAAAAMNTEKINLERYLTIGELSEDYNAVEETGRATIWKRGMAIFAAHPLTGVGADNFQEAIGTWRRERDMRPLWQSAHNSYVQVLTETGILGASAFLALIVTSVATLISLTGRARLLIGSGLEAVAPVFLTAFIAQLFIAFFLSQGYSVLFVLVFAATAALRRITEPLTDPSRSMPPGPPETLGSVGGVGPRPDDRRRVTPAQSGSRRPHGWPIALVAMSGPGKGGR